MDDFVALVESFHMAEYRGDDAHGLAHSRRVLKIAQELSIERSCDYQSLAICAYFHDIVSFKKGTRATNRRAKTESTKLLERFFSIYPEYQSSRDVVHDCVESHSFSERKIPAYWEGKVIQDADKIDALGYVGVARLFMVAGKMGSCMLNPHDPLAENRKLDDRAFALDHVAKKLAHLPSEMNTAAGKQLAKERLNIVQKFIDGIVLEQTH